MSSIPSKTPWTRRKQCPCGDWKCYISYEGEAESTSTPSQLVVSEMEKSGGAMVSPYVGMVFKSDSDAFSYYGNFARNNGFAIRKERSRLSQQLGIYKRDFVCYRSGFAPAKKRSSGEHHRERKSVRCGCDAKMFLSKEVVEGVPQWFVVQFSNVHNHELLEDDQVRLLPAYRKIQETDQQRILLLSNAGFPVHRIMKVLELEKGILGGQLPFLERDVRNLVQNRKKSVQEQETLLSEKRETDTIELLDTCKATREADGEFIHDYTMDENDKIVHISWSYGDSINAYSIFGDVVHFNTSHCSVTYGLLFGAWLGIDNHGRTIFFGCVLLQDETPRSFAWALQTFIRFMGGRCPRTILSDLDPGLRAALQSDFPGIKHVISAWNIFSKVSSWFSIPLESRYAEFRSDFDALYRVENTEDFEARWNQMVSMFGLISDKHIALLYSIRSFWALAYVRGYMLAQMETSTYCKSVDAFVKGIFCLQPCLRGFLDQISVSAALLHQRPPDMQYVRTKTSIPIEDHARGILTPFAFGILQQEIWLSMQYASSEMGSDSYLVRHFKKMDQDRVVVWVPHDEQVLCSCKEFESSGLLCRHAIRVLILKNYFQLPEKYLSCRWSRESSLVLHNDHSDRSNTQDWLHEYQALTDALLAESSITRERSEYVGKKLRKEMARLLNEIRSMPESDGGIDMDLGLSPST